MSEKEVTNQQDRDFLERHEQHVNDRLNQVERQNASTQSDIRTLFNMIESIGVQIDRLVQTTNKPPNMIGMIMALFAGVTLVITVGAMAMWPVNQRLSALEFQDAVYRERLQQIVDTRFGKADGERMEDRFERRAEIAEERVQELTRELGYLQGRFDSGR